MNRHVGSRFDDFLEQEGILAEANAVAVKRVITFQPKEKPFIEATELNAGLLLAPR